MLGKMLLFELKHNIKNISQYIYIYSFFICVLLISALISDNPQAIQTLGHMPVWVALSLGAILSASRCFEDDHASGFIQQIQLTSGGIEGYVAAKFMVFCLMVLAPACALIPISSAMGMQVKQGILLPFMLAGASFLACIMMAASITAGIQKAGFILQILVLPWMIPVLIFASHSVGASSNSHTSGLEYTIGLAGFLVPLSIMISAKMLRRKC